MSILRFFSFCFALIFSGSASAALLDDVQQSILNAQISALTVGTFLVGAVAALIVVNLIIGMVRKL